MASASTKPQCPLGLFLFDIFQSFRHSKTVLYSNKMKKSNRIPILILVMLVFSTPVSASKLTTQASTATDKQEIKKESEPTTKNQKPTQKEKINSESVETKEQNTAKNPTLGPRLFPGESYSNFKPIIPVINCTKEYKDRLEKQKPTEIIAVPQFECN
jgi:hypothetical protein